jgi:hypothetical protein
MSGNFPGTCVDKHVYRRRERGAVLHQVVADEPESAMLYKDGRLVAHRPIPESKYESRSDLIAADDLGDIANRNANAFHRFQRQKAMLRALVVANWNGLCA